jgi:resolvase-like protein
MKATSVKTVRCAIYTRVSTDQGLDQEFNSLDAQYEASSAYVKSQAHAGWTLIKTRYDDGGYSGGSTDRPDLQKLLDDIRARKIDVIVVYKVDRLTRSLAGPSSPVGPPPPHPTLWSQRDPEPFWSHDRDRQNDPPESGRPGWQTADAAVRKEVAVAEIRSAIGRVSPSDRDRASARSRLVAMLRAI